MKKIKAKLTANREWVGFGIADRSEPGYKPPGPEVHGQQVGNRAPRSTDPDLGAFRKVTKIQPKKA